MSTETVEQPTPETPASETPVVETPETPEAQRDVESDTLDIPDATAEGGTVRYVPLPALQGARDKITKLQGELDAAKQGSARASQLEQQIAALSQQVQQMTPYVQAYQAAIQPAVQPPPEDDTEATELAQTLDLYTVEGKPDVTKAKKLLAVVEKRTDAKVQQQVQPLHQQTAAQQSQYNFQRALNTDVNGVKADPEILRALWNRVPHETTRDPEAAKHLLIQALGMSVLQGTATATPSPTRAANGQFTQAATEEIPPPLHSERAGGRAPAAVPLSAFEKQIAKEMGLSETDYLKRADAAPWLRKG